MSNPPFPDPSSWSCAGLAAPRASPSYWGAQNPPCGPTAAALEAKDPIPWDLLPRAFLTHPSAAHVVCCQGTLLARVHFSSCSSMSFSLKLLPARCSPASSLADVLILFLARMHHSECIFSITSFWFCNALNNG